MTTTKDIFHWVSPCLPCPTNVLYIQIHQCSKCGSDAHKLPLPQDSWTTILDDACAKAISKCVHRHGLYPRCCSISYQISLRLWHYGKQYLLWDMIIKNRCWETVFLAVWTVILDTRWYSYFSHCSYKIYLLVANTYLFSNGHSSTCLAKANYSSYNVDILSLGIYQSHKWKIKGVFWVWRCTNSLIVWKLHKAYLFLKKLLFWEFHTWMFYLHHLYFFLCSL